MPVLPPTEVIVVDDGSTDQTPNQVAKFPFVKYVRQDKNIGKGTALSIAFKIATSNIFVIQDADMEYSPMNIPKLLEPILEGQADVVYGSRFLGECNGMSISHRIGNVILSFITRLLYGARITDVMTGHKCFIREVGQLLKLTETGFAVETEITAKILKKGWRFKEVPVSYSKRTQGFSKIRYRDGLRSMLKLFSELRLTSISNPQPSIKKARLRGKLSRR